MDWSGWLERVDAMQLEHRNLRVVSVSIPGGLPKVGWNVPNPSAVGFRGISQDPNMPHMREGVMSNYHVSDGDFEVRFNNGLVMR